MPWSINRVTSTSPHQAVQGELVLFDLATAAADAIVNVPTSPAIGTYFGVTLDGQAGGYKIDVKTGGTVLYTLNVDNETVWLAYNGSTWRVTTRELPEPNFEPRFSPLASWLSVGADANLIDGSGNSRDLTKGVTIPPGPGYGLERLSTAYTGRYSRADATFLLTGAMSYEFVAQYFISASGGFALTYGVGSGGATTNMLWGLRVEIDAGVPKWGHRQQSGANINSDLRGPACAYGWSHLGVTRSAAQLTKFYVNGALAASATLTTPDGGGSTSLFWGGTSGIQAPVLSQYGAVWNVERTPAEMQYLARLRLSKRGPLGS